MKRNATAVWQGTGKDGKGNITTQSHFVDHIPYSSKSRFENELGTNPEELIAGAHAGCFTMKLAYVIEEAGFTAKNLETTCQITIKDGIITTSHLNLKAKIDLFNHSSDEYSFQPFVLPSSFLSDPAYIQVSK